MSAHKPLFIQARTQKEQMDASTVLEEAGFRFVEATLVPYVRFGSNAVLSTFVEDRTQFVPRRFRLADLSVDIADTDSPDIQQCLKEIARSSFTDDRFHVDIRCPVDVADRRFEFWVNDLLRQQEVVFDLLRSADTPIAFMARKGEHLILAGFRADFTRSGLGAFLWLSVLVRMQEEGLKRAHTLISLNNTAVLNLYSRLAFKFKEPGASYHFWSD